MFITTIILLVPFLTVACLPWALGSFSSRELDQMGVQLDSEETPCDPVQESTCLLPRMQVTCGNA